MNKKKIVLHIAAFAILLCFVSPVLAAGNVTITDPLGIGPNPNGFAILLGRIATGVGALIATLGTIMLIVAGIFYLTSAGSPERITKAKTALVYAIVGIAIGLAATAIVAIIEEVLKA